MVNEVLDRVDDKFYLRHDYCGRHYYISRYLYNKRKKNNEVICVHCNKKQSYHFSNTEKQLLFLVEKVSPFEIIPNYKVQGNISVDCYIPELKLAFDLYGDVVHANTKKYFSNEHVIINNKRINVRKIWAKNSNREYVVRKNGILLVILWESDFKKKITDIEKFCTYYIEKMINSTKHRKDVVKGIPNKVSIHN